MTTVVDLYTIQIIDERPKDWVPYITQTDRVASVMAEMEENLTDLLPDGYRARIRAWDHPYPDEEEEETNDDA